MLNEEQLRLISDATLKKTASVGLKHARENASYIKKTIRDLRTEAGLPGQAALVISAGPSLHKKKSLQTVSKAGFGGCVVAADGALGHCLRNNIIPDYVLTVDPDPHRIIRWFGDPRLSERPKDDYFLRQDLEPALNSEEKARNRELIDLVNLQGPKIKLIISTSSSPELARRCMEAGMELYWWNPIYDDYEKEDSLTKQLFELNKAPCMVTGGNVGSSAWVFAHSILKRSTVVLVGMDFSYAPGTNVRNTQYYDILMEIIPDHPEAGLIEVYNPYLKETWLTDPAYFWYTRNFLGMAPQAACKTYNCTEGGILFGEGVEFAGLAETLSLLSS